MKKLLILSYIFFFAFMLIPTVRAQYLPIELDGDFTDWIDKALYDSRDNDPSSLESLKQLKWHLDTDQDMLYIMLHVENAKAGNGSFKTQFRSNSGNFSADTDYDTETGSVMVQVKVKNQISSFGGNWCKLLDDGTLLIEYGVPIKEFVDMQWGYLLKFRLIGAFGDAPKNSWIEVSTISTYPVIGVIICILAISAIFIVKRKKAKC